MADTLFSCDICQVVFERQSAFKNHVRKVHQTEVRATFSGDRVEVIKRDTDGRFKCMCGKSFLLRDSVRRHTKTCVGDDGATLVTENVEEDGWTEEAERQEGEAEGIEDTVADLSYDFVGIHSSEGMSTDRL
jgi:uncharacterized C2H2 Zn-finger protein